MFGVFQPGSPSTLSSLASFMRCWALENCYVEHRDLNPPAIDVQTLAPPSVYSFNHPRWGILLPNWRHFHLFPENRVLPTMTARSCALGFCPQSLIRSRNEDDMTQTVIGYAQKYAKTHVFAVSKPTTNLFWGVFGPLEFAKDGHQQSGSDMDWLDIS